MMCFDLECPDCKKEVFTRYKLSDNFFHYKCQWCGLQFDGPGIYYKTTRAGCWRRNDVFAQAKNITRFNG